MYKLKVGYFCMNVLFFMYLNIMYEVKNCVFLSVYIFIFFVSDVYKG